MMKDDFSYDAAMRELQAIVQELQTETAGIDQLNAKVKRAAELILLCKVRLRKTEEEIKEAFEPRSV